MALKLVFSVLIFFVPGFVQAQDATRLNPDELLAAMTQLQGKFESMKPAQIEAAIDLFPTAMSYLSAIQTVKGIDNRVRIAAAVKLAVSTVRFDETIPAADVLSIHYSRMKNRKIYQDEIARSPQQKYANILLESLNGYVETLRSYQEEDEIAKRRKSK